MKTLLAAALVMMSGAVYAGPSYEVCTDEGPCALRVTDNDTGEDVWLVTEKNYELSLIWGGTYWIVDQPTYDEVREIVPERLVLPAKNPTTGVTLAEAKGGSKPAPSGPSTSGGTTSGGKTSGGLITVGNITVGGGSSCEPCHGSDLKKIHAQKLEAPKGQ